MLFKIIIQKVRAGSASGTLFFIIQDDYENDIYVNVASNGSLSSTVGGMCEEVGVVRGRVSMQRIVMRGEVPMRGVRIFVRVVGVEGEMVIVERC